MKTMIFCASLALAGCGAMEPWTPEQAAVFMQYQQRQQAVQYVDRSNPVYQPMQTPQQRETIRCQSSTIGQQTYTSCR